MYHIGFKIIYKLHPWFHQDRCPLSKKAELFVLYKIIWARFFFIILETSCLFWHFFGLLNMLWNTLQVVLIQQAFNQRSFDFGVFFQLFTNYIPGDHLLKSKQFFTKGLVKPKADWRAIYSPKKWTDEFVLFTFSLFKANKQIHSFLFGRI